MQREQWYIYAKSSPGYGVFEGEHQSVLFFKIGRQKAKRRSDLHNTEALSMGLTLMEAASKGDYDYRTLA